MNTNGGAPQWPKTLGTNTRGDLFDLRTNFGHGRETIMSSACKGGEDSVGAAIQMVISITLHALHASYRWDFFVPLEFKIFYSLQK